MSDFFTVSIYHHDDYLISLEELSLWTRVSSDLIYHYIEYGLLEPVRVAGGDLYFDIRALSRLRAIQRLRSDIGVNMAGIAVILELNEKVLRLQKEVERLRE